MPSLKKAKKRPTDGRTKPGFTKYCITRLGKVWSDHVGRYRKPHLNRKGYPIITLRGDNGKTKTFLVHRLVAELWIPNPLNLPEVHHIFHDTLDCRASSLKWVSKEDNRRYWNVAGRPRKKRVKKVETLPCNNSSTKSSYVRFRREIGTIPEGKLFTGFSYKGEQYDSLNKISKAYCISFTRTKRLFNLGEIVICIDHQPQPPNEQQKTFAARVAQPIIKIKRYHPIDYDYYQNLCSQ